MKIRQLSGPGLQAFPCNGSTTFVLFEKDTIASPCSSKFLGAFQGLQRAINAYVRRFGVLDIIREDGDIGPRTLEAAQGIWDHAKIRGVTFSTNVRPSSVSQLASLSPDFTAFFAVEAGVPVDRSADPASAAHEFVIGQGTITPTPGVKKAGIGGILAISALAGLAAFKIFGKKRRG